MNPRVPQPRRRATTPPSHTWSGVASHLIVDGPQRLTTLMLIPAAIRDAAARNDDRAVERYDELYLINRFPHEARWPRQHRDSRVALSAFRAQPA